MRCSCKFFKKKKLYSSLYMIPNSCGTYDGHALFPLLMHFIRSFMDFHYLLELQTSFHALPVYFVGGGFHSFELHFSTHPNQSMYVLVPCSSNLLSRLALDQKSQLITTGATVPLHKSDLQNAASILSFQNFRIFNLGVFISGKYKVSSTLF